MGENAVQVRRHGFGVGSGFGRGVRVLHGEHFNVAGDKEPIVSAPDLALRLAAADRVLGIDGVSLELNSLGTSAARAAYRERLTEYLRDHFEQLDEDARRRLDSNPLRIPDSKNREMQTLLEGAPRLMEQLDEESRDHFAGLRAILDAAGLEYRINTRLVRGLDYYGKTVFEWVTDRLGAQGTLCAGGRYDALVEQLGGKPTAAIGFAMGVERLVAMLEQGAVEPPDLAPHAYLVVPGESTHGAAMALAEGLRDRLPSLRLLTHCGGGGIKGQIKRADKSGAELALILGESERAEGRITVKRLRGEGGQESVQQDTLTDYLAAALGVGEGEHKGR